MPDKNNVTDSVKNTATQSEGCYPIRGLKSGENDKR